MPYYLEGTTSNKTSFGLAEPGGYTSKSAWADVDSKFWGGQKLTSSDHDAFPPFFVLNKGNRPTRLPDVYSMSVGPYLFREHVKDEVERLEPGVHEFIPVHIKTFDETVDYGQYFYLVLRQKIDAIDEEHTAFETLEPRYGQEAAKRSKYSPKITWDEKKYPLTLHEHMIRGKHFWRGTKATRLSNYFCSDAFHDFCVREKVWGLDFYKCQVRKSH